MSDIARAYITKDNRVIAIIDGLEEELKCQLALTVDGVHKLSGRCSKQNRLDFLKAALELSTKIEHDYPEDVVISCIEKAYEHEND